MVVSLPAFAMGGWLISLQLSQESSFLQDIKFIAERKKRQIVSLIIDFIILIIMVCDAINASQIFLA